MAAMHTVLILDLHNRHQLSAPVFFGPLQRLLQDELQESRPERLQHGLFFSAVHLNFLWHWALLPGLLHGAAHHIDCLRRAVKRLPLPPTKHPVVVTLDGGGMRVMITLGLQRALERRLAGAVNTFAEIPDLIAGTSVGAVIGTDLVYNNTSAAEAYDKFPDFTQSAVSANRTIQSVCQRERRLFDAMTPSTAGHRLAIVVSRISDGKSCLFPNYRGMGGAGVDPTSQATVSSDLSQNPLLWESPWFFHCKHVPEFGTLQDGGVRGNNSFGIAQEECRIIWPSAQTFDLMISVGTGYVPSVAEEHIP
ncbi:hypothetical protein KXW88_004608, partial [Aspergillus fumigatus]